MKLDITHINSEEFRRAGLHFQKHGFYTQAPRGTYEYEEFWREEKRRCKEGYSVGGVRISGDHYGYLNFSQIKVTQAEAADAGISKQGTPQTMSAEKKLTVPDFWDGDFDYFWVKDIARRGLALCGFDSVDEVGFTNPAIKIKKDHLTGGKHIAVAKARRKGYSYKNGWICASRYTHYKNSISVIGAFDKKYLYPEGTMGMASRYLDHLDANTEFGMHRLVNSQHFKESGKKDPTTGNIVGKRSKIIAVSFGDNPGAARGKDGTLVLLEEAGKFPNLVDSVMATLDTLVDGIYVTGQMIIFGTGGGDSTNWEPFNSIYYNPDFYNMIAIEDPEPSKRGTFVSFFVPDTQNKPGFMDKSGFTLWNAAQRWWDIEFDKVKKTAKAQSEIDNWLMEHPIYPSHSFKGSSLNILPTAEIQSWKSWIESHKMYRNVQVPGYLYESPKGVEFRVRDDVLPINKFPHERGDDISGCYVEYQKPYIDPSTGEIPDGMYIIAHDPYDQDESLGDSLGSACVYLNVNNRTSIDDCLVAEYDGRPATVDEYNRTLFLMAKRYNAKIGFENDRGDVIGYAKRMKIEYMLEKQFDLLFNTELVSSDVRRPYGMHMTPKRKLQGMLYLRDWLLQVRGYDKNKKPILNLHMIFSLPLLEEMLRYNPKVGNYDRVSRMIILMYYIKEMEYKDISEALNKADEDNQFGKPDFFSDKAIGGFYK